MIGDTNRTNATGMSHHDASADLFAPRHADWRARYHVEAVQEVSRLSRSVVLALQDGAMSAREGDTSGLTYADGWAAACTLAQLVAFDVLKPTE